MPLSFAELLEVRVDWFCLFFVAARESKSYLRLSPTFFVLVHVHLSAVSA